MSVVDGQRVFALHPVSVAVRLEELHEGFHGDLNHVFAAGALEEEQDTLLLRSKLSPSFHPWNSANGTRLWSLPDPT